MLYCNEPYFFYIKTIEIYAHLSYCTTVEIFAYKAASAKLNLKKKPLRRQEKDLQ